MEVAKLLVVVQVEEQPSGVELSLVILLLYWYDLDGLLNRLL